MFVDDTSPLAEGLEGLPERRGKGRGAPPPREGDLLLLLFELPLLGGGGFPERGGGARGESAWIF